MIDRLFQCVMSDTTNFLWNWWNRFSNWCIKIFRKNNMVSFVSSWDSRMLSISNSCWESRECCSALKSMFMRFTFSICVLIARKVDSVCTNSWMDLDQKLVAVRVEGATRGLVKKVCWLLIVSWRLSMHCCRHTCRACWSSKCNVAAVSMKIFLLFLLLSVVCIRKSMDMHVYGYTDE